MQYNNQFLVFLLANVRTTETGNCLPAVAINLLLFSYIVCSSSLSPWSIKEFGHFLSFPATICFLMPPCSTRSVLINLGNLFAFCQHEKFICICIKKIVINVVQPLIFSGCLSSFYNISVCILYPARLIPFWQLWFCYFCLLDFVNWDLLRV